MISTMTHAFILFYKETNKIKNIPLRTHRELTEYIRDNEEEQHSTLERINSGHCGLAAIAIGCVLKRKGFDVKFFDNGGHAYLGVNGGLHDTLHPTGTVRHSDMYGYFSDNLVKEYTLNGLHNLYLYGDEVGIDLVDTFVRKHTTHGYRRTNTKWGIDVQI